MGEVDLVGALAKSIKRFNELDKNDLAVGSMGYRACALASTRWAVFNHPRAIP
jgi:hypothetical protein